MGTAGRCPPERMSTPSAGSSTRPRGCLLQVLLVCHLLMIALASEAETEASPKISDDSQDTGPMKDFSGNTSSSGISDSADVSTETDFKVPIGFDNFSMPLPEEPELRLAVCFLRQAHRADDHQIFNFPGVIGPFLTKESLNLLHLENASLPKSCLRSLCSEDIKINMAFTDDQPSLTYFAMYSATWGVLDACSKELEVEDESVRSLDAEGNSAYHINCCYRLVLFSSPSCLYVPKEKILPLMSMYVFTISPPKCLTSILCFSLTYIEIIVRENKTTVWVPQFHGYLPVSQLRLCYAIAKKINDKEIEEGKRNQSDAEGTVAYFPMLPMHEIVTMKQPYCLTLPIPTMKLVVYGNSPLPESCLDLFCLSPMFYSAEKNNYFSFNRSSSNEVDGCLSHMQASSAVTRQDNLNILSLPLESDYLMLPPDNKCFFLVPQRRSCLQNFQANFEVFSLAVHGNTTVTEECLPLLCEPVFYPLITEGFRYFFNNKSTDVLSSCYSTLPSTPGLSSDTKLLKLTSRHGILLVEPKCPYQSIDKFTLFTLMNINRTFPSQCFAELCYQDTAKINVNIKNLAFYLGHSSANTGGECFLSIQNSSFFNQREADSQNCTMLAVKLLGTTDLRSTKWENTLILRDPSCGYNRQFGVLTVGRFMNFLSTKLYASAPEDIKKPYQCLANRLESGYDVETLAGAVDSAEKLRAYTYGAKLILPSSCLDLACEQSITVFHQAHIIFGRELKTYIPIFTQDVQSSKIMTKCIAELKTVQSNDTEVLENDGPFEVSIPSSVSISGSPSLGTYSLLFATFPDCRVTNGFLRASQISYAYLFLKDFPSSCLTMICDSDTMLRIENVGRDAFIYTASKTATAYGVTCLSQLEDKGESFGIYTEKKNLRYETTSGGIGKIVFDFDPPRKYSSLYGYLLLQKRSSNIHDSCLRCLIESNVEKFRDRLIYMMVPYNDSISECNLCFSTGNPITSNANFRPDLPDVVVLLNSTISLLLHRSQNRAEMVLHENLLHQVSGYLYFYSHNLFHCMSINQSIYSLAQDTPTGYEKNLVFTKEVWSTCLNEIQTNANFVCTPKQNYTLCSENMVSSGSAHINLLFLLPCRNFSVDTLRLMSRSSVLSHIGWKGSNVYDHVCHTSTLVAEFTTYSRTLYYETIGRAIDIKQALGDLHEHWKIIPSTLCIQFIFRSLARCSEIYNLEKLYEVINSQTGVNRAELNRSNVLYQCLTYNHARGSIKLLRVIATEGFLATCETIQTYPNTTYAIKERDAFRMLTISRKQEEESIVISSTINDFKTRTGQCPMVSDSPSEGIKDVLRTLAAAVAQNNSECVENVCTGHFKLLTNISKDLAVLGPLTLSVYGTSCYTAVPSNTWREVDLAMGANRVTLNKFWPACYFDHIVIWNSADAKANEWDYLSTCCRVREIIFFIINVLLTLMTILVNLIVIITVFKSRTLVFNSRFRLQVNLAISDLLMGVFVGGQALHDHLGLMTGSLTLKDFDSLSVFANFKDVTEEFTFGLQQLRFPRGGYPAFCGFVFSLCSFVSLTIMSLLTLELLLGSSYANLHFRLFTPVRLSLILLFLWLGGIAFSILLLQKEEGHIMVAYFDPISKLTTSLPSSSISSASFIAFYSAVTLFTLTSLFVVVVSVISIVRVYGAQSRLRKEKIDFRGDKLDSDNRSFRNLVSVFVSAYLLSVVPLAIGSTGNLFLASPLGHYFVWWIYMASSAWNPFLYNVRLKKFKAEVRANFDIIKEVLVSYWRALIPEDCDVPLRRIPDRRKARKETLGCCKETRSGQSGTTCLSGQRRSSRGKDGAVETYSSVQTPETIAMESANETPHEEPPQKDLSISPGVETSTLCSAESHASTTGSGVPLTIQATETPVQTPVMTGGVETPTIIYSETPELDSTSTFVCKL